MARTAMKLRMCKANSFLLGVLPDIRIMVAERKRVDRLVKRASTPEGVPLPPYRREKGGESG